MRKAILLIIFLAFSGSAFGQDALCRLHCKNNYNGAKGRCKYTESACKDNINNKAVRAGEKYLRTCLSRVKIKNPAATVTTTEPKADANTRKVRVRII